MSNKVDDVLTELLVLIKIVNDVNYDEDAAKKQQKQISSQYHLLNGIEKNCFLEMVAETTMDDQLLHIYLLSIILLCVKEKLVIEQIVNVLCKSDLNVDTLIWAQLQLTRFVFINQEIGDVYVLRRVLHKALLKKISDALKLDYKYRKLSDRNQERIVVITGTLLSTHHAPSKIVLEQCYLLQKILKKEVLLIVSPVSDSEENKLLWFQPFNVLYNESLENNKFVYSYKDISINGCQLAFNMGNMNQYRNIISSIYNFNPLCVISMGSYCLWEDVLDQFTNVVVKEMSTHYPVSEASLLFCNQGVNQEFVKSELNYLLSNNQIPLEFKVKFELDKAKTLVKRSEFQIAEDAFEIVIVGNRLDFDISDTYLEFLNRVLELDRKVSIAFIGNCNKFPMKAENKDRVYYLGYQSNLADVYIIADLYLNPPRKGGGISALLALNNGIPVVTLPNNDVAINVGNEFVCNNNEEIFVTIKRYLVEENFYKEQQKKGFEITHNMYRVDAGINEMVEDIRNAVKLREQKIN
jgi:hypothetical protein